MLYINPMITIETEIVYFIAVAILCLGIYMKTKDIYKLTKLDTIFHFRNIFMYFFVAYAFRLLYIFIILSNDLGFASILSLQIIGMLVVSYFSTMAILSVLMAVIVKNITMKKLHLNILLHLISAGFLLLVFVARSLQILFVSQIAVLAFAVIFMLFRKKETKFSRQNRITYIMLFIFWVINLVEFGRGALQFGIQTVFYVISVAIFLSIYLRIRKRLENAKKKRKTRDNK